MAEASSKNKTLGSNNNIDKEEGEEHGIELILSLKTLNLGPKKKLLIMPLGGFLCHRVHLRNKYSSNIPKHRLPDASHGSFHVYKRPFCEDFIRFCLDRFEVGIWSSATEWYMKSSLDSIMPGLTRKLLFAWERKRKPIFIKELRKVWEGKGVGLSRLSTQFSSSNTLLIDNEPYKALLNPPHTAIFPDEYKAENVDDSALGVGSELRLFLEKVAEAEDVTCFIKDHAFGKSPITPEHPNWEFYSKIIRAYGK